MVLDPLTHGHLGTDDLVTALKAVAEPTRLRILVLLSQGELNVKDLTQILDQSQPRLSRHLKLLSEAGLVERFREGSWVYFHISERSTGGRLALKLLRSIDKSDPVLLRDRRRVKEIKTRREAAAQDYFKRHAADWDTLRSLHVSETEVEAAMAELLGPGPFEQFIDLGTGTGRILELFSTVFESGLGVDVNTTMLSYARSKLNAFDSAHVKMRHADLYDLPIANGTADVVTMHQVLHYISDPAGAIIEAARILKPGGQLLIVDFAPHELEFLRENHAHERLGFSRQSIETWFRDANIKPNAFRQLMPGPKNNGGDNLTVSLWLGTCQSAMQHHPGPSQKPTTAKETI